jgi:hypothetical protein
MLDLPDKSLYVLSHHEDLNSKQMECLREPGVWNSKGEHNLDTRVTSTVSKKTFRIVS